MKQSRTVGLLVAIALLAAGPLAALSSDDNPETLAEQARALAAERAAGASPLASGTFPGTFVLGPGPLFIGVDNIAVPAYRLEVPSGAATQAFIGFEVWGAAYDATNDRVFVNDGSSLYEWPVGAATPTLIGTIVDGGGAAQSMVGLAWYNDTLYGTKNIANEAIWEIDPVSLVATVFIDYDDASLDCGGFAVDQATGEFYCTNDDTSPLGNGLFRINGDGSATQITPYPGGETDIDGLTIGNGLAYFVTDQPGDIYVWDLAGGAFTTPITNPWTTAEVFSGAAWIEAGVPQIEVNPTSLQSTQVVDTQVVLQLDISNAGTGTLNWGIDEAEPLTRVSIPAASEDYARGDHAPSSGPAPFYERTPTATAPGEQMSRVLASNAYSWNSQAGQYYTVFDIAVPEVLPIVAPFVTPAFLGAGEWVNGVVYMLDGANNLYVVDPATGAIMNTLAATPPPGSQSWSGMALDPTDGTVYASSTDVATSMLFTIDLTTGTTTLIGTITNSPGNIAIAIDGAGILYGYDIVNDTFMTIDKGTGAGTVVGPLGFDANFGQGMGWDSATDTLYMVAFNNGTFQGELRIVDRGTGNSSFVGILGATTPGGLNQLSWVGFENGGCPPLVDLPWLSVSPTTGSTGSGNTDMVDVTFDSTGLMLGGLYEGNLCIASNDPANPTVAVPVTLMVDTMPFLDGFETGDTSRWSFVVP